MEDNKLTVTGSYCTERTQLRQKGGKKSSAALQMSSSLWKMRRSNVL